MPVDERVIAEITQVLTTSKALFENGDFVTPQKLAVCAMALASGGLTPAEVKAAMLKLSRTSLKYPAVAAIFTAADELRAAAQGTEALDAGAAWEEAMLNARRNHVYKPWKFSRPEVEQAVNQFGKAELCELESNAVNTARAQFMRIYTAIVERGRAREQNTAVLNQLDRAKIDKLIGGALKQIGG